MRAPHLGQKKLLPPQKKAVGGPALSSLNQSDILFTMAIGGETYQERSKGKDVRTSNIVAAKVRRRRLIEEANRVHRIGRGWPQMLYEMDWCLFFFCLAFPIPTHC